MEATLPGRSGAHAVARVVKVFKNESGPATIHNQQMVDAPAAVQVLTPGNVRLVCVQVGLTDPFVHFRFYLSMKKVTADIFDCYFRFALLVTGEVPRKTRGSLIGMVNEREFGVSFLEANITDNMEEGSSTLQARLDNIPPTVGESGCIETPKAYIFLSISKY